MSSGFDAYHKWLSIPPREQPPNHYRLLGLGLFETDPDVISAAADRQMAHVQTYKNGPHSAESQKLLNEIAVAKLCLLKPAKRDAYDAELRRRLAEQPAFAPAAPAFAAAGAPVAVPGSAPRSVMAGQTVAGRSGSTALPPPPIAVPPPIDEFDSGGGRLAAVGPKTVLVAGSVLILLLVVAIVIVMKSGWNPGSSTPDSTTNSGNGIATAGTNQSSKTADATTLPAPPSVDPATTSTTASSTTATSTNPPPSNQAEKSPTLPPDGTKGTTPTAPAQKSDTPPTVPIVAPTTVTPNAKPPAADAGPTKKLLVPDSMAAAAAEARFAEMFGSAQPDAILEQSKPLADGPLVYVALTKALGMAASSGDVTVAGRIVEELSRRFTIETVPLRAKAYLDLRRHIATSADWHALGEAALASIDEAVAANRADLAMPLAETSLLAARRSGNLDLIRKVTLRVIQLQEQGPGAAKPGSAKQPSTAPKAEGSAGT